MANALAKILVVVVLLSLCGCSEADDYVRDFKNLASPKAEEQPVKAMSSEINPVTALEWYYLASKIASKWDSDPVFVGAVGDSVSKSGKLLPVNGTAEQWSYQFVSIAKEKKLRVFIADGQMLSKDEEDLGEEQGIKLDDFQGLIEDDQWKVDSDAAVKQTAAQFKELFPGKAPNSASYILFNLKKQDLAKNTSTPMMVWTISYEDVNAKAKVRVNAVSGEIVPD